MGDAADIMNRNLRVVNVSSKRSPVSRLSQFRAQFQGQRADTEGAAASQARPFDGPPPPRFGGIYLADMLSADRNSFAIIRMAMALCVLVSHSYWFAYGSVGAQPLVKWTGHSLGEHAVQVFFLLSGILVAQSLQRSGSIVDYVCARGLRIFPALGVCVFLTAFLLGPIVSSLPLGQYLADNRVAAYIVKTLTLSTGSAGLPGVFEKLPLAGLVNVSLWTLKFEVLCYMLLALLGVMGLMKEQFRLWSAVGLAGLVSVIFLRMPVPGLAYTALDNVRYLMLFFFTGVLAFQCRTWLLVHGLLVLPLASLFAFSIGTRLVEVTSAVFLGYTMLWIATFKFGPLRAFTNKNDYSYGTYIYAGPIQQMVVHYLPQFSPWVVTAFSIGMAVPMAVYSWELIERPALGLRQPVRDWLLAVNGQVTMAAVALKARLWPERLPAAVDGGEMDPAAGFAAVLAGAAGARAPELHAAPRRQRRATLVGIVPAVVRHTAESPASTQPKRRMRPALSLKRVLAPEIVAAALAPREARLRRPIILSPEVITMHQSKRAAAFQMPTAANSSSAKSLYAYAARGTADAADAARTPYARNWLLSLGWLEKRETSQAPQGDAAVQLGNTLEELKRRRAVRRAVKEGTLPAVAANSQTATSTGSTLTADVPAPRLAITAPAKSALMVEPLEPVTADAGGLRTWLSALTAWRQPVEEAAPEPVAEIPADRLAQALRPRTQVRPKWKAPANDTGNDPLPV
jgi:peptidoglycan/LPS O-acetylase OafA/YrhL